MRAKRSQRGPKHGRFFSMFLGLSALLFVSTACQFGGSFDEARCESEADCSGEAICVEGFCTTPGSQNPDPDAGKEDLDGSGSTDKPDAADIYEEPDGLEGRVIVEIKLEPESLDLQVGQTGTIVPTIFDEAGDEVDGYGADDFSWSSNAPGVALPVGGGEVRALSVGPAVITVSFGELSATAEVEVAAASAAQIELFPETITLMETGTFQAQVRAYDSNGVRITDPVVDWVTEDPSVATVDEVGIVTALSGGHSTELIVSMRQDPTVRATSDVVVSALVPATALISPSRATITAGQKVKFEVYDDQFNLIPNASIT